MRYKDVIKRSNIKLSPLGGNPMELVLISPSPYERVQQIKNEAKTSTSQSWASLIKLKFH